MQLKITLNEEQVDNLLNCKNTNKKNFKDKDINQLLQEAINDFHYKYKVSHSAQE